MGLLDWTTAAQISLSGGCREMAQPVLDSGFSNSGIRIVFTVPMQKGTAPQQAFCMDREGERQGLWSASLDPVFQRLLFTPLCPFGTSPA